MNNYTRTPRASRRNKKNRAARTLLVVCMMLVVMVGSIAGTVAWLTAQTDPVTNTFTVGDINITLEETTTTYHIVPGVDIAKDPKVTVGANSEDCWLFVRIEKTNWSDELIYKVADGWTELTEGSGIYWRKASANNAYYVLAGTEDKPNGVVTVSEELTKAQAEEMKTAQPQLTFTAYAVQQENIASAADAWSKLNVQ